MPEEEKTTASEQLGYDNINNELVDEGQEQEDLLSDIKVKLELEELGFDNFKDITLEKLGEYIYADVFSGEKPKTYSQMKNLPFLNFSLRAAMQHIGRDDTEKYDAEGKKDDANGKTIDEHLKGWGGLTNEYNKDLVMFLQNIVGAHPDGLAGPQTVWKVLDKLGYDVKNSAEGVNNLYKNNDKFQVVDIGKYQNGDKEYKFDQTKIKNGTGEGAYDIKFDSGGKLTTPGLKVESGWIVLDSLTENKAKDMNDSVNLSDDSSYIDDSVDLPDGSSYAEKIRKAISTIKLASRIKTFDGKSYDLKLIPDGVYVGMEAYPRSDGRKFTKKYRVYYGNFLTNEGKFSISKFNAEKEKYEKTIRAEHFATLIRNQTFSKNYIFPEYGKMEPDKKEKIDKYFSKFRDDKILVDGSKTYTYARGSEIYVHLDDKGADMRHHIPVNNEKLRIDVNEISDDNLGFNKEKFKDIIKSVAEQIMDKW